jgi:translation initiation factor 3 subunit G
VTNLSEDTTESDLQDLFRRFGHTSRIYLAKDRQTFKSRGFAFVNFSEKSAGQAAIDKLNGW